MIIPLVSRSDLKDFEKKKDFVSSFRDTLKQERLRADRFGRDFSVLVYEVIRFKENRMLTKHFIGHITSTIRMIDEIGWYDKNSIGILLHNTSYEDAQVLADRITRKRNGSVPLCNYTIYTYPPKHHSFNDIKLIHSAAYPCIDTGSTIPFWKRTIDIVGSALGLLLLLPFFCMVAFCIKIVSHGPIFFIQKRVGRGGKIFKIFKFRTMKNGHDSSLHLNHMKKIINGKNEAETLLIKPKNNEIIPFGKFLRKYCIDELPQLVNVLRGDMSLVGPRPCTPYEAHEFLQWHLRRFDITPGMTGLWQVSGKNKTTFKEMIRLDIKYSMERSFRMDFVILLKTPYAILSQHVKLHPKIQHTVHPVPEELVKVT